MEPLTGVMRTIDLPDACPTCGVAVEGGHWPSPTVEADFPRNQMTLRVGAMILAPCGHPNQAPDAD